MNRMTDAEAVHFLRQSGNEHVRAAGDRIEAFRSALSGARKAVGILLNEDSRYVVNVGGNPLAVDAMVAQVSATMRLLDDLLVLPANDNPDDETLASSLGAAPGA